MNGLPSPADSPSLDPVDSSQSPLPASRKRQRSQSMQSDASESSKRPVSEPSPPDSVNRGPKTDGISNLSIRDSNNDIDAYMSEQADSDKTDALPVPRQSNTPPTPLQKHSLIISLKQKQMIEGETWYLVSRSWYRKWKKAVTAEVDKEGSVDERELGAVENRPLLDEYGNLRVGLADGMDLEYVPEEAWSHFVSWYGEPDNSIPRSVILRGESKQPTLELHPPRLNVYVLAESTNVSSTPPIRITVSSQSAIRALQKDMAKSLSHPTTPPQYRVWKIDASDVVLPDRQVTIALFKTCKPELLEEIDHSLDDALVNSGDSFVVEFKQSSGEWLVDLEQLRKGSPQPELVAPAPLFGSSEGFFERMSNKNHSSSVPVLANSTKSFMSSASSSTRSRSIEPGTLGLGNMGNTCFMNSALQCLAHTKELSEYFLTGLYKHELNPDNPLGMHGAIAEVFGALMHRMWDPSAASSYSPREFKQVLQRFAPQFSGYQQHDSQELVAFLLDGLHEDLNRVLKKPYVEKPDWEGGEKIELVKLANTSWEGYMKRNDSVIVDLFQGQYQSTLVCPVCEKVSITFDPFMYLTLPLPVNKKWSHTIYYVPWDLKQPHVKIPVETALNASVKDLRQLLGRWMGVPADNLLTLEVWSHRFYKSLHDNVLCSDIVENDLVVCFELPCHAQQSRTYKPEPDDPFIVPVYLADLSAPPHRSYTRNSYNGFGYPFIVVLDQEQAQSKEAIYDAVVQRLQRWTVNARDLFTWEVGSDEAVPLHLDGSTKTETITEFKENGEVVTVPIPPEEGDIVDEKGMDVDISPVTQPVPSSEPHTVGTKKDIFHLRIQSGHSEYGTGGGILASNRFENLEQRAQDSKSGLMLRAGDGIVCQFDENMKAYYFGDETSKWEHALWDRWDDLIHPEFEQSRKAASTRKNKGITLQDCLDEFVKEEKLGEEDLWYCPQCKKHQQASKKFDLWKTPDILAVHLKRFSSSRAMRDKIDSLVDFPVAGLDLSSMVGERRIANQLKEEGVDIAELGLEDHDQSLIYDLFAVDEHMGGLGGGHYRAYSYNHVTDQWYHFDDSYVTKTDATHAVNPNAYLLFYRRRSSGPLGGNTHRRIEEARLRAMREAEQEESQLPTPPSEDEPVAGPNRTATKSPSHDVVDYRATKWYPAFTKPAKTDTLVSPYSLDDDDDDPPLLSTNLHDSSLLNDDDPLSLLSSHQFVLPEPSSSKASPSSSVGADVDLDESFEENTWDTSRISLDNHEYSPEWPDVESSSVSRMDSPAGSSSSDPFSDGNAAVERRSPDIPALE